MPCIDALTLGTVMVIPKKEGVTRCQCPTVCLPCLPLLPYLKPFKCTKGCPTESWPPGTPDPGQGRRDIRCLWGASKAKKRTLHKPCMFRYDKIRLLFTFCALLHVELAAHAVTFLVFGPQVLLSKLRLHLVAHACSNKKATASDS